MPRIGKDGARSGGLVEKSEGFLYCESVGVLTDPVHTCQRSQGLHTSPPTTSSAGPWTLMRRVLGFNNNNSADSCTQSSSDATTDSKGLYLHGAPGRGKTMLM